MASASEKIESGLGLVVVSPLLPPALAGAEDLTRLVDGELPTTLVVHHRDVTHGRVLKLDPSRSRDAFEQVLNDAEAALNEGAAKYAGFSVLLDSLEYGKRAVYVKATGDVDPVEEMRRWMLGTLADVDNSDPSVKNLRHVHTTVGRLPEGYEPNVDIGQIVAEVAGKPETRAVMPLDVELGSLVLCEEVRQYELITRAVVKLG